MIQVDYRADDKFKLKRRPVGYISGLMKRDIAGEINIKPQTSNMSSRPTGAPTHGKANRPSTPIQGVISFTYANMAEMELKENYNVLSMKAKESRHHKPVPGSTRARELAAQHI